MLKSVSNKNKQLVDLSEAFLLVTNDVVCRVVLGRRYGGGRFKETLSEFVELIGSFNIGDFVPMLGWVDRLSGMHAKFDRVAKDIDHFLDEVVEEHNGGGSDQKQPKDFVDVLLEIQKDPPPGVSFDRVNIKAVILDMFAAGTDTTYDYDVLEWAMSELLRHPKSMEQLQNEVRTIAVAAKKTFIDEDDLEQMPYLKAVIKETHRLHPPLPLLFPRESTADATVMGYEVPSGTLVFTNVWSIGRDPESWDDEPEMFKPERFLNSSVDFRGHDFELIPFGAGRRGCPGINFATTLNELVLANLANRFDWELPAGVNPQDLDMAETVGLTTHRKTPLLANATLHHA